MSLRTGVRRPQTAESRSEIDGSEKMGYLSGALRSESAAEGTEAAPSGSRAPIGWQERPPHDGSVGRRQTVASSSEDGRRQSEVARVSRAELGAKRRASESETGRQRERDLSSAMLVLLFRLWLRFV